MTARRHHYVPQCYLRGFVSHREKAKLFVVDAMKRTTFSTSPLNVANERDFHRVDIDGLPPDALETAFGRFEGELAPALERIIAAESLAHDVDRNLLLNLIALLATKNPRHREGFRDFNERVMKQVMQLATATPERWASQVRRMQADGLDVGDDAADYQGMRDFVRKGEYSISLNREFHLQSELQSMDAVLRCLVERKWTLLRAPARQTGFVTSDHPVCLDWIDSNLSRPFHGPGFGLRGTRVLFPISNSLAAIAEFDRGGGTFEIGEEMVANLNTVIMAHADRQIYARDGQFRYREVRQGRLARGADLPKDPMFGSGSGRSRGRA